MATTSSPLGRSPGTVPSTVRGTIPGTARLARGGDVWFAGHMPRRPDAGASAGALRSLVGAGPSQVGVVGALRARDVSRPSEDDVRRALALPEPQANPPARQDSTEPGISGDTPVSS